MAGQRVTRGRPRPLDVDVRDFALVLLNSSKPDLPTGCWIWQGSLYDGHGRMSVDNRLEYVHVITWTYVNGMVPDGLVLDHLCRQRACVRWDHLEAVTQRENLHRAETSQASLNSRKTHCPRGHPYDHANTHISKRGSRSCRACARDRARERYRRDRPES